MTNRILSALTFCFFFAACLVGTIDEVAGDVARAWRGGDRG